VGGLGHDSSGCNRWAVGNRWVVMLAVHGNRGSRRRLGLLFSVVWCGPLRIFWGCGDWVVWESLDRMWTML
jgi:hypothetical protein